QALDELALLRHLGGVLPQPLAVREIDAARVRGRADAAARAEAHFLAQELEAAVAHHLDVAHQVDIGYRNHALCLPEAADLALVEAVDGADLDAVHVLALDAVFGDDVGHALIIAFRAPTFAMSWKWE